MEKRFKKREEIRYIKSPLGENNYEETGRKIQDSNIPSLVKGKSTS